MNPYPGRKPRVLLLDDSATARAVLSAALGRRGYEVITARDLSELDAALDRMLPDVVLLDVHLPEIVGTDLIPWLRDTKRLDRPILLCSTRTEEDLAQLAEESGADGWVRKNSRPDELAARVEHFLAGGEV
jgi:DNA-binding response OmpR family regulator